MIKEMEWLNTAFIINNHKTNNDLIVSVIEVYFIIDVNTIISIIFHAYIS